MRLAFTSCMSVYSFPVQPVWDEITAAGCDELVLLGDSAYYDVQYSSMAKVQSMTAHGFATHAYERLRTQLTQANFAALVRTPTLRTHAIWDDHDFLWNDACGGQIQGQPQYSDLLAPTRAVFAMFRKALEERIAADSLPVNLPPWSDTVPEPGYSNVRLADDVLLHLTDGRSYKSRLGREALMGKAQLDAFELACEDAIPETVHLLASGVMFERPRAECWADCSVEHARLLALRHKYRILMISGDVHENALTRYPNEGDRFFYEATSSGAAIYSKMVTGTPRRNWGLLQIDADRIQIQLFQSGEAQYERTIDRNTWQWTPGAPVPVHEAVLRLPMAA
ncbi:hypothetical protein ACSFA8_22595 [Variovorax sp. RT4R15]|uniref:hypothetical protein n=1 Tax=Variovorax sp. RT4R15 TaxID=3443737 RepID=UPI003F46F3DB